MGSFLDELDDPPVVTGEIVPVTAGALQRGQHARLRSLEDEILLDATETITGALGFSKISDADITRDEPPAAWVRDLGPARAAERFRLAKYALMSQKDAPVGLKIATAVHSSIVKARATEKGGTRVLNVALVQMPAANITYPKREVGERK